MHVITVTALAAMLSLPVAAQQPAPPSEEQQIVPPEPLADLFERLLRGFADETAPHLRNLERQLEQLEPEIERFWDSLRGMAQYHPPEILPNGDILIRRRQPVELPPQPPEDQPEPDLEAAPFEL